MFKHIFKYKFLSVFIIVAWLMSCEERTDWDFDTKISKYLVVDGMITNEMINHQIKISESASGLNSEPTPISGASVHVLEGTVIRNFEENPIGSGIYLSTEKFTGVINKLYVLTIKYKMTIYTATARMIPVTPITPLIYMQSSNSNLYYIKSVAPNFDLNESDMYQIKIDRSKVSGYENVSDSISQSLLYYYTLQTLDVNEIFAPQKETVYFPAGTQIVERKFSLAPKYADFIRSLLAETEWRGGYFDVAQDNVRSNLSDGAVGFFAACSVVSDTLIVK